MSRVTPPDTSTRKPAAPWPGRGPRTRAPARGHVVEQHHRGAGGDRLLELLDAVALHLDDAARPQRLRARCTASVIESPARWLSFTSTKSESEPRWLTPPPARTAAFSSARSPGMVLRVSQMRTPPRSPATASTNARVGGGDAGQVAEEVERGALAGEHGAQRAGDGADHLAGREAVAVGDVPGDLDRRGRAARTPRWRRRCPRARRPARATTDDRRAVADSGTSAAVRSPSGPMSSASARATTSRTTCAGGPTVAVATRSSRGLRRGERAAARTARARRSRRTARGTRATTRGSRAGCGCRATPPVPEPTRRARVRR